MSENPSITIFDILLQLSEQAVQLLISIRPILVQLKHNRQILQVLSFGQSLLTKLPDTVTLSLTVLAIFLATLLIFRVGKSLVSLIITLIQITMILVIGACVWKIREPLRVWLELILNQ